MQSTSPYIYETTLFNSIDTDDSLLVLTFDTSTSKSHPKTACLPSEILLFIYDHLYRSTSPERKLTQLDLFSPHQTDAVIPCKQKTFTRCWFDVGPPSTTLGQHQNDIESKSLVYR